MEENITILYVDDEPINIVLFRANFRAPYKVISAKSGVEALEELDKNPDISVVISDMQMPKMTGIDLIRQAFKKFPGIKYFLLSGFDITTEIEKMINEKILTNYFNKPLNIDRIKEEINSILCIE